MAWAYMGFSLGYGYVINNDPLNKYQANVFTLSYFMRQYKPLGKGFYLFGQEAISAGFGTGKAIGYDDQIFNSSLSINPGMAYNISKHMQLELELTNILSATYTSNKNSGTCNINYPAPNDNKQFVFSSSLEEGFLNNIAFGIRFFL